MSDRPPVGREALAAALERFTVTWRSGDFALIAAAARERLAQLPEDCGYCENTAHKTIEDCEFCNDKGYLYPSALERAARALQDWDDDNGNDWWGGTNRPLAENYRNYYRDGVRVVLDALNTGNGE